MVLRKIIAVLCSIAISFSLFSAPAAAITVEQGALCVSALQFAYQMYHDWKTEHPDTPDSEYTGFHPGGTFGGSAGRRPSSEELAAAYSDYVQTLPATGYASDGKLVWQPTFSNFDPSSHFSFWDFSEIPVETSSKRCSVLSSGNGLLLGYFSKRSGDAVAKFDNCKINVPVPGHYQQIKSIRMAGGGLSDLYYEEGTFQSSRYIESGKLLSWEYLYSAHESAEYGPCDFYVYFPVFEVIPAASLSSTYSTTTRPTSITGGNYGVVGDNNEITKVEDNSTIVNETNNTYYNPATGTTVPITNWSYDYSDRSYKVTLESGDTATITYGDENISITETNTTSGDTITNNYTIYYLVDGPDQSACAHEWSETSSTPATCTVPGSKLLTCSLCSKTKTESIPVLGHDWEVKQTVNTQYDETGQLVQQGYTVFECTRCHEQSKSEDGVLPPEVPPGSGTDIAAVDALKEKLQIAADALLGIFHKLPELFSGFTDFLAATFPFVPTEFITIFELGLFLLIAAAALRKFLS